MIVELADVKEWLGITVDTYDDALTSLIERTGDLIESATRVYFGDPREVVEEINGTGTRRMNVGQVPTVPDEGSVEVYTFLLEYLESGWGSDAVWAEVEETEYKIDGRTLYSAGRFWRGLRIYRATYSEGFETVPGDIQQLSLELIANLWKRKGEAGLKSERIGDYAYTREDIEESSRWSSVVSSWVKKRVI